MVKTRNYGYRTNTKRLVHMATRFWLRRRTKQALMDNWYEITVLRHRLQLATMELNEWRWKIGGAAYTMNGKQALELVERGMKDKGYPITEIVSVDQWSADIEPSFK